MENKKRILKLLILKDEIHHFHSSFVNEPDFLPKMRLIKGIVISINTFVDELKDFNYIIKKNIRLKEDARSIRGRGKFFNHIRNKIGGHLDDELLLRAAQWEPFIFNVAVEKKRDMQIQLAYKAIIEAAINSYIDEKGKQKVFETEIDLMYDPDYISFSSYLMRMNLDSIKLIDELIDEIEKSFKYSSDKESLIDSKIAGLTDFSLRKPYNYPRLPSSEDNTLIAFAEKVLGNGKKAGKQDLEKLLRILQEELEKESSKKGKV